MTQDEELSQIMKSVAEKSMRILAGYKKQPAEFSKTLQQYIDLTRDFQSLFRLF